MNDIHAALIQAGWAGKRLPRDELEAYLARDVGLSLPHVRQHIDTGKVLGLWHVIDRRPRSGALLILPPREAAAEKPSGASA